MGGIIPEFLGGLADHFGVGSPSPANSLTLFNAAGIFWGARLAGGRNCDSLFNLTPIGVKTAATAPPRSGVWPGFY